MGKFRLIKQREVSLFGIRFFRILSVSLVLLGIALTLDIQRAKASAGAVSTTSTPDTGTLPSNLFGTFSPPPQWQAAQAQSLANIFGSCTMGAAQNTLNNMAAGAMMGSMGGGGLNGGLNGGRGGIGSTVMGALGASSCPFAVGVTLDTVCPGSDKVPEISNMMMGGMNNGGMYGNPMMQGAGYGNYGMNNGMGFGGTGMGMNNSCPSSQMKDMIDAAACTSQCKSNKLQAIQSELGCLSQQASLLATQVGSLTATYTKNIQKMQKDIQNIKLAKADRAAQLVDVNNKLQGDPSSGRPGLLALKQNTEAMIKNMPTEILEIQKRARASANQQQSLDEQIQTRTMSLTMACFTQQPMSNFRCAANGPPVTAANYLSCRFRQNQTIGSNGVFERDATTGAQATANQQSLDSLIQQIETDTASASQGKIPTGQGNDPSEINGQEPLLNLTIADIQNRYGAALSAYKVGGMDAGTFLMSDLKYCNGRSQDQVAAEESRKSSTIGVAESNIQDYSQETSQKVKDLFNNYSQAYNQDINGLTGQNIPMDTSNCDQADVQTQINCLNNVQSTMKNLLQGSNPSFGMKVQIKGNNPSTYFQFSCQGLNGCVTALQNTSSNLTTEQNKLDKYQQQYILNANQSTAAFTQNMANRLGPQSQLLSDRMKKLNGALASLGQAGINVGTVKGEETQYDEDGLVKPPSSALSLIGPSINPPMLDVNGDSFSGAVGGMTQAQNQIESNLQQIMQQKATLDMMQANCNKPSQNRNLTKAVDQGDSIAASNCHTSDYCKTHGVQTERALYKALSKLRQHPSVDSDSLASLETGVETFCKDPGTGSTDKAAPACAAFYSSLLNAAKSLPTGSSSTPSYGGAGTAR